ncbi:uncharacterized protein LOC144707333 [Wolffia australiana]
MDFGPLKSCSKIAADRQNVEEMRPKKVKMRDLDSILRSEERDLRKPSIRLDLDLNVADNSDSTEHNPFRNPIQTRSTDLSECGSTTGPPEESEPLRRWREMKQNGFITSLHGGIPPIPKQRGRPPKRRKEEEQKKKLEATKREQISRFHKVTSPSGLLSGLNPGIINHVRNSKQVHSIIEALVKSEKAEEKERETQKLDPPSNKLYSEDDSLALKLSSAGASENVGSSSTDDVPANGDNLGFLSFKAASVASQWLELLYQDTRGRLAALRRSRKRVRFVLQRELPSLLSAEPLSSQENSSCFLQSDTSCDSFAACSDHGNQWRDLFNHMDLALSEEGKHLERLLAQVREMQMKCENGLQLVKNESSMRNSSSLKNRSEQEATLEGDYAVRAAAASLYSVCSFILTTDNVSCF